MIGFVGEVKKMCGISVNGRLKDVSSEIACHCIDVETEHVFIFILCQIKPKYFYIVF